MKIIQKIALPAIISVIVLSSCSPADPPTSTKTYPPVGSYTYIPSSTATPIPTTSSSPVLLTPSPWPTVPFIITPNADQLARWQEYEKALAEEFISHHAPEDVLCEWLLLGQSEQEIYVWVSCQSVVPNINGRYAGISAPGVIYLGTAGSVQNVRRIVTWTDDIHNHFPPDLQELLFSGEIKPQVRQMFEHITSRMENLEPPLIVLSAMSAPNPVLGTPLPTQLTIVPTLNPTQVIQHEEIKSVIQEYFDIHYQALSISPPEDFQETSFGDLISELPEARDFEEIEVAKLQVQAKYWELNKFRFTDYNHTLEYDSFTFDQEKNQVTVYLLDKAEAVQEISLVRNPKDPRVTYLEFGHIFILHKEGEEWKIVSDTYFDSWWQQFRKPGATKEEILNAIDAKRQKLNQTP